ncbi:hypothetical protein DFH08DRAFT_758178 [Mycena albidolilacea]|uniref:Uncharacterized protein n=1 Tax=Mycena albidolilacea TaxID=1033008 RepID=A0AAD7EA50_9AGAR|nr:hypothetical protein DFH08DRAFT_758178 [Mycena albidolilacea]
MSRANEPPTVLEDLSRDELLVLARQNEKALNDERVRADTAEKRAVLADTTNRSHRGRPRKRTRPTRSLLSDDENIPDDDQVEDDSPEEKMRRAGHKYVITEGLWFSSTAESVLETKLSQSYEEKNRFANQSQKKQGELRAVRDLLPEELRGELRKEWVIFEFDKAMGRQRSNTSSRLRNEIEPVFNIHLKALDAERFKDVADVLEDAKRAGLADLIGGKKNAAGKITYHPLAAPVLHSDGSISHNPETFLHNKLVMHVAAAIIFGKQKARTLATGKGSSSSSRCMQDIHQITRTTPGMVRNASVLTLWTLSADTSLKKCGQQTAVNWHLIGEQIHEWLLNGLRNRHEPVLRLFREWDDELFPDTEASLGAALGTGSANTEDLHEALEALSHTQVVEMDTGSGDEDDVEGTTGADGMDGEGPRGGVRGGSQANESAEES